jgi:chromosome partitioning protein
VIVVFSPCGGTGKTSLVANLGRALALQGEDVLLLDTSLQENLAHHFGAAHAYPGDVQITCDRRSQTRLRLARLPVACYGPGRDGAGWLRDELAAVAVRCDRIVVDLSTASRWLSQQIFRLSPLLLVPMLPDWNAVLALPRIEEFLEYLDPTSPPVRPHFILNQFDPQLHFHRAVLDELRARVGDHLLAQVLHYSIDVGEALAHGKTVLDLEPDTQIAWDYRALADWVRSRCALDRTACACGAARTT